MKPEIKQKWIEALRSGQYKQGRQRLRDEQGNFCCLGVLTDLYRKEVQAKWRTAAVTSKSFLSDDPLKVVEFLPSKVVDWAGLSCDDPAVNGVHLTYLNDSCGSSFKEIADLIEKHL